MTQTVAPQIEAARRREHPMTTYYLLLGATVVLLVLGLAMVLSAGSEGISMHWPLPSNFQP